jgi:hypothetical protein
MFSFNDPDTADQWKGVALGVSLTTALVITLFIAGTLGNALHVQQLTKRAEKAVACAKELGPENALLCREIYQLPAKP